MTDGPRNDWFTHDPSSTSPFDEVHAPVRVGRYTLAELIGRGGMGVVYEAVQDEPRRRVAVKLLRNAVLTADLVRRFKRESEILGNLRHPNIAEVIEAGTHVDGRIEVPYYAMQLIESALPITRFAVERSLSRRERIALFIPVCRAVQYAHDHEVVHRDIKPSNLLVDKSGIPRLIDLGLSRVMSEASQPLTTTEYLFGTLQYMSPEQLLGTPPTPSTKWDVYSLGVVLYELLLGELPYRVAEANPFSVAHAITRAPPTPPREIDGSIPRDLETVVLKAIHKDAERRYRSAGELADDLERWTDGRAVKARGDSAAYVLRKAVTRTIGRHLIATSVVVCFIAFLLGQPLQRWSVDQGLLDWWARQLTLWPQHAASNPFRHVVIVKLSGDTDQVGRLAGLNNLKPSQPGGSRPLHGKVIERLSEAGARVIAVDMMFRNPSAFDAPLVAGIAAARSRGADVVVGTPDWKRDGEPQLLSELRSICRYGPILGFCGPDRPWGIFVARLGPSGDAELTLVSHAVAASLGTAPKARFQVSDDGHLYAIESGANLTRVVPFSEVIKPQTNPDSLPARLTDDTFSLWTEVPETARLEEATLAVQDVFRLPIEDLRKRVGGKVVLYGDGRPGNDPAFATPDGRMLAGHVAHAIAVEHALSGTTIAPPLRAVGALGFRMTLESTHWLIGPCIAVLAVLLTKTTRRTVLVLIGLVLLSAATTLVVYRTHGIILSPFTTTLLSTAAGVFMLCCKSLKPATS